MKSTKLKTKQEKGITLMALIITIVVLLVLATVAINSVLNDGIISKAQDVANKFNEAQSDEQNMIAEYLNYLNGGNGSNGGGTTEEDLAEIDLVERYVLGPEKTGKSIMEIINIDVDTFEITFLNDESTIADASVTMHFMFFPGTSENIYMEYNNKVYKAVVNATTFQTEDVEMIYKKEGREGQTVEGGTYDGWIILTDRDGLVEIVSPDTVGELTLGSGDTSVIATTDIDGDGTVNDEGDKAILSYNNAITRINNYCKEVMNLENVRSVGGTDNSAPAYHSTNYDSWGEDITVDVASGDNQYELDFVKLSYFGKLATTEGYYLASRLVEEEEGDVDFGVVSVFEGGWCSGVLWSVQTNGDVYISNGSGSVRPVVINPSGI